MRYSILCIFLKTGTTFTFQSVEVVVSNENHLQFDYVAMSDGKTKTAHFPKGNIAGWSVTGGMINDLIAKEDQLCKTVV